MENLESILDAIRTNKTKTCIYGLGLVGSRIGKQTLELLNLQIDFFCDSDERKIQGTKISGACGMKKEALLASDIPVAVFVFSPRFDSEIREELSTNRNLIVLSYIDIRETDYFFKRFYEVGKLPPVYFSYFAKKTQSYEFTAFSSEKRIAVYTCITGGYDAPKEPEFVEPCCDYYLISDRFPLSGSCYKFIPVDSVVPDEINDKKDQNRYCKMHADIIFKDYDYSIYFDGSITLKKSVSKYVHLLGVSGLAIHKNPDRDCIYIEGMSCCSTGMCDSSQLKFQMRRYMDEGMPRKFGDLMCCIIVRDHKNSVATKIMREWFAEYMSGEKRDQLSLPYILWKNNLPIDAVGDIFPQGRIEDNPDIAWEKYSHAAVNIKF